VLLCERLPLEKDRFGGSKKMWQNMEQGSEVGEQQSDGDASQMPYVPNGLKGHAINTIFSFLRD
jgi:hypothetical protein